MKPNGYLLHSDGVRIIIATGFARASTNDKTGEMIQIWTLPLKLNPINSVQTGLDSAQCGDCPLRGSKTENRLCYVRIDSAPTGIWKAFHRGAYPKLPSVEVFAGRKVRFGAYGEPVFLPFPLFESIAKASAGWTGYTHQWRRPIFQAYQRYLMASVETEEDTSLAWSKGWRTYRIRSRHAEPIEGEIDCPSSRGVKCANCRLCRGSSTMAKSISIHAHGNGINFTPNKS